MRGAYVNLLCHVTSETLIRVEADDFCSYMIRIKNIIVNVLMVMYDCVLTVRGVVRLYVCVYVTNSVLE